MVDWAIITGRLLEFAATLVLFGASLFYLYGLRAGTADDPFSHLHWPRPLLRGAAIAGLLGVLAWVMAQTALISDNPGDAFNPAAVFSILAETRFGRICSLRLVLLCVSATLLWRWRPAKALWIAQAVIGGAVLASFAWTGHGASDQGWAGMFHLCADVLHLLAAGLWIGALVPLGLLLAARRAQPANARAAYAGLLGFSGIGVAAVGVLILTGLVNSWFLIGPLRWRSLFTTPYGLVLLMKLGLFGLMLAMAAANRYRLTPRLHRALHANGAVSAPLRALRTSVLFETALAFLVLIAVAFLGTLEPPVSG